MIAAFERFDGSRTIKNVRQDEASDVILVPRRNLLAGGEVADWMRYDRIEETHEGLPLFRQSDESLKVEIDGETVTVVPMQRDAPRSAGEISRAPRDSS